MKLSKETLAVIKNFSGINSNILLKQGNTLGTISAQKNVMAETSVTENFSQEFGIYDLNEFLGALSLFEDPDLEFSDKFVTIREGSNSIKFFAADSSVLVTPTKSITFPESDIDFKLTAAQLSMIQRTSSVLRANDVSFVGADGNLSVVVGDKKNATSNNYELVVAQTEKNFRVNLKVENLKMLPGDYDVSISEKKISRFKGAGDLVYFVAVEADSSFA